jgi:DNA-binding transcriptional MerR regulator
MLQSREPLWTLDELCAQAALALAVDYAGQASGRVRDLPDRRTVRYYTTLGLLDHPVMLLRRRLGLYGRRHLLQLVAVKRLQANGLSLSEVQSRLLGRTDAALQEVARLPDMPPPEGGAAPAPPRDGAFWKVEPAPAARPEAGGEGAVRPLLAVPLADGATLLLDAARPPDEHDLSALRTAAAPLLALLRARRLLGEP